MMITSYNKSGIGDVLIVMLKNSPAKEQRFEKKGSIARIYRESDGVTVGFNFFDVSEILQVEGTGQILLTEGQIAQLNDKLSEAGFTEQLESDPNPRFVVGEVKECTPHPDSDHLSVTQTEVDNGEVLQIVCGAPNIAKGQKVVVAKVGTVMPDGMVIWDGELRGQVSEGMICSARELRLKDAPQEKGILVLPDTAVTGAPFEIAVI